MPLHRKSIASSTIKVVPGERRGNLFIVSKLPERVGGSSEDAHRETLQYLHQHFLQKFGRMPSENKLHDYPKGQLDLSQIREELGYFDTEGKFHATHSIHRKGVQYTAEEIKSGEGISNGIDRRDIISTDYDPSHYIEPRKISGKKPTILGGNSMLTSISIDGHIHFDPKKSKN